MRIVTVVSSADMVNRKHMGLSLCKTVGSTPPLTILLFKFWILLNRVVLNGVYVPYLNHKTKTEILPLSQKFAM